MLSLSLFGILTACQGPVGPAGLDGVNGADGVDGADGVNGADGVDGADGVNGADGADGADGAAGESGASCWDLDGNGAKDLNTEDTNGDGSVDVFDCRFSDPSAPLTLTDAQVAAIEAKAGVSECAPCHKVNNPNQWQDFVYSRMAAFGDVTCVSCHEASPTITVGQEGHRLLPSPETCATCHPAEYEGHRANRHSIASIRNYECGRFDDFPRMFDNGSGYHFTDQDVQQLQDLMDSGHMGAGANENPTAVAMCMQCHNVEARCDSCHTRHKFSPEEAREPAACGTCHMGPDHPQIEMYETSKHGVLHSIEGDTYRVPVCVDCHMPYNGKIFPKKVDGAGKPYVSHDLSETIAYGPVGGGTVRQGFVSTNGRVKFTSKEAAGVAAYDTLWLSWADGKVYTDANGTTVAYPDIYTMSIQDVNANNKQDYQVAQVNDTPTDMVAARALMLSVCTTCHAQNFADEKLLVADLIHENAKSVQLEAFDLVQALAAADVGPYGVGARPVNPESGTNDWEANMLIRNLTELEREYFHVMKYDQVKTWKGAYHFNPDYTHWYGWTELNLKLGAMGDIATQQVMLDLWVRGRAYPGLTGDIFDDGLYPGVFYNTGLMTNYFDKFPGAGDSDLDWFDADGLIGGDGTPDNTQPIDIDGDGVIDLDVVNGSGASLPAGTYYAPATGRTVTLH